MTSRSKQIIEGALIATSGAFAWALLSFAYWHFQRHNPGETLWHVLAYAAYAVLVASWFVLPMGAILGGILPRVIRSCTGYQALLRGGLIGLFVGVIAAVLTMLMTEWPTFSGNATSVNRAAWERSAWLKFGFYTGTMSAVCLVWVGVWAYKWSQRKRPDRSVASHKF